MSKIFSYIKHKDGTYEWVKVPDLYKCMMIVNRLKRRAKTVSVKDRKI